MYIVLTLDIRIAAVITTIMKQITIGVPKLEIIVEEVVDVEVSQHQPENTTIRTASGYLSIDSSKTEMIEGLKQEGAHVLTVIEGNQCKLLYGPLDPKLMQTYEYDKK